MAHIISFTIGSNQKLTDKLPDGSFRSIEAEVATTVGLDAGDEVNLDGLAQMVLGWQRAVRRSIILPVAKKKEEEIVNIYLGLPPEYLAMMGVTEEELRAFVTDSDGVQTDVSASVSPASNKESK